MCLSPRQANRRSPDAGDWLGTLAGLAALAASVLAAAFGPGRERAPAPGAVMLRPEMVLRLAPAPMPEVAAAVEPEPEPEIEPEPEPEPEPESELEIEEAPEPEPEAELPPPESPVEPEEELAPSEAVQVMPEPEGAAGEEAAIRDAWLEELRRRIEQSKYYPGSARYARKSGTVRLRVQIGADGRIGGAEVLENSGPAALAEGARGILRRAAERPLGDGQVREGFAVEVPISYRMESR